MKQESLSMVNALLKNCELNIKNAQDFWEKELWITMREGLKYIQENELKENKM